MCIRDSGGGVATASLAIVKVLGARAIVTSSSGDKLARARELGAEATVNHTTEDVAARVKELADGGVHVVVETVGADTWQTSLTACRPAGRVCVCGDILRRV